MKIDLSELKKLGDIKNLFLCFKRDDGIDAFYKVLDDGTIVYIDEHEIARYIEASSNVDFVGFGKSQSLTTNIWDLVPNPTPDPKPSDMKQLRIQGFDPVHPHRAIADISKFCIALPQMQVKDESLLEVQACTHTITTGEEIVGTDLRGMVDWTLEDLESSNVLVKVEQTGTTVQGVFGGEYGNNHPSKNYIPGLQEDSTVFVPIKSLRVNATNKGDLPIDYWIIFPWSENGLERRIYRDVLEPKETKAFVIDADKLGLKGMSFAERGIKINFNTIQQTKEKVAELKEKKFYASLNS